MRTVHLKNKISQALVIMVLLYLFSPVEVDARTVIRTADTVSIGQEQLIEGDFYTAANIINISGQIQEDLLAAGAEVNVNGQVNEDVLIVGGNVDIHGTVGDDLRIIGSSVVIAEPVLGDVFVVGTDIKILSTASISGDVTVVGGNAEISGLVEGRVFGWIESLRIDGPVNGSVDVTTAALTLGDKAEITGNVEYTSYNTLERGQSADVGGEIVRSDPVVEEGSEGPIAFLLPLLMILFSAALWYLLSRRTLQKVVNRSLAPNISPLLIGISFLILTPFAITILLLSMLGLFAGLVLLAVYLLFVTLAVISLPVVMVQFVYSMMGQDNRQVTLVKVLLGTLLLGACSLVPFVGPVIIVGVSILILGAITQLALQANR